MSIVAPLASEARARTVPMAMVYVGVPAYLLIVAFSVRDIARSHSPVVAAVGIVAVVAFSCVFLGLTLPRRGERSERHLLGMIGFMGLLAVVLAALGTTTTVYLAAVAAMAGDGLRPRLSLPFIIGASAVTAVEEIANGASLQDSVTQPVIVLMVGFFTLGLLRVTETNRELIAAREQVARLAVANERLRFARDLHDLVGHTLTVIRAKSELASRVAPTDLDCAIREMDEVGSVARQALAEVRETVTGYRRLTLLSAVADARSALDSAGIHATVTADPVDLPVEIDETLGWVLREAVTNVVRHSGAAACRIDTTCDDGIVVLEVADDGQGPSQGPGNGLTGVRERLSIVGGSLEAGSGPGGGFRIVARVPGTP